MIQIDSEGCAPKSRALVGRATLAIELSRTVMAIASPTETMAQYRAGVPNPSASSCRSGLADDPWTAVIQAPRRRFPPRRWHAAPRREAAARSLNDGGPGIIG